MFSGINVDVPLGVNLQVNAGLYVRTLKIEVPTGSDIQVLPGRDGATSSGMPATVDSILDCFIADKGAEGIAVDGLFDAIALVGLPTTAALLINTGDHVYITTGINVGIVTGIDAAADNVDVPGRFQNGVMTSIDFTTNTGGADNFTSAFM